MTLTTVMLRTLSKSLGMVTPHERVNSQPYGIPATIAGDAPMSEFYRACASEALAMHQQVATMLGDHNGASFGTDDDGGTPGGLRAFAITFRARLQGAGDTFELLGGIDDADAFLACMRLVAPPRRAALRNAWSARAESPCERTVTLRSNHVRAVTGRTSSGEML